MNPTKTVGELECSGQVVIGISFFTDVTIYKWKVHNGKIEIIPVVLDQCQLLVVGQCMKLF